MKNTKRLFHYISPFKLNLTIAILSAFIGIALSLLVPILIGKAVDCIVSAGNVDFDRLFKILITLTACVLSSALFQWFMTYHSNKLSYKTVQLLRTDVFTKLSHVPLSYIDTTAHGDIINSVVTDIDIISTGLLQGLTQVLSGVVTILGTLMFMFMINPYIAAAVVVLTPLSFFVASFIAKRAHKSYIRQAKLRGKMTGYASEMIERSAVVTAFNQEENVAKNFFDMNEALKKAGTTAHFYSALTNPCTRFVNAMVYAVVAVFGAVLTVRGIITVGNLTSFLSYCTQYTKPFNEISSVIAEFQNALASAGRVFDILDREDEISDKGLSELQNISGNVDFQNVSFSYSKTKRFIEALSLQAKAGQTIAIVGPTGCGKTTLINLLMRFYDIDGGKITVDTRDIYTVTRSSLRSGFGMVLQETWLFSGTIFENIAYGKPGATRSEVIEAAKSAHAHSFIKRLENGYETQISENADNLSEGQKQLLCIARVMLTKPPMLILDEATSSIDTRTELRIQKAFLELMQGRTTFIVAHRLSTIKNADTILVMQNGKIVEQGDHNTLLQKNGLYTKLYNSQFAVY